MPAPSGCTARPPLAPNAAAPEPRDATIGCCRVLPSVIRDRVCILEAPDAPALLLPSSFFDPEDPPVLVRAAARELELEPDGGWSPGAGFSSLSILFAPAPARDPVVCAPCNLFPSVDKGRLLPSPQPASGSMPTSAGLAFTSAGPVLMTLLPEFVPDPDSSTLPCSLTSRSLHFLFPLLWLLPAT